MTQTDPQISVVIPAKDEVAAIAGLIDEVAAALKGRQFEVIVVDDVSTDGTTELRPVSRPPSARACGTARRR